MGNAPNASICRICSQNCGILVSGQGADLSIRGNPDNPVTKGFICFRGVNFRHVHLSEQRLKTPLLKKNGSWTEISYPNAMDILAEKFNKAMAEYGPQTLAMLKGESLKHQEVKYYLRHLCYGLGTPNYMSVGSLCHKALAFGHGLTYGGFVKPDFNRAKSILIWGANPAVSSPVKWQAVKKANESGIPLVVVDPARSQAAQVADLHLALVPGSDGFLALALLKHGVENLGLNPSADAAIGWDEFAALLSGLSIDDLLEKSGIDGQTFQKAANMLFENRPGYVLIGAGLELRPNGIQSIRSVAFLQSILDPDSRPRPMAAPLKALPGEDSYPDMPDPIGTVQAPFFTYANQEAQGMVLDRAITKGVPYPIKAMLIAGSDPVMTFPDIKTQQSALSKLDFLTVFDLFLTPTAQLADLVLPATDHLEHYELHDYAQGGPPFLGLVRPAAPSGHGWPLWKVVFELARRLGKEALFPWQDNIDAIRYRLAETGVDFDQIDQSPGAAMPYKPVPKSERWNVSDGKIHYFSEALDQVGPFGKITMESFSIPYHPDDEYPFWLNTGDRTQYYQHAQYRQIEAHRSRSPEPYVEIHPDTAEKMAVANGETVGLATRHGRITVKAKLIDIVRPDCLRLPHGWIESPANALCGLDHLDPISGFPWMKALPARLEKLSR
jgi:anaerobic selenocysteine-containing dehydrogenase